MSDETTYCAECQHYSYSHKPSDATDDCHECLATKDSDRRKLKRDFVTKRWPKKTPVMCASRNTGKCLHYEVKAKRPTS